MRVGGDSAWTGRTAPELTMNVRQNAAAESGHGQHRAEDRDQGPSEAWDLVRGEGAGQDTREDIGEDSEEHSEKGSRRRERDMK